MTRIDAPEGLDFEWHEDILYREPQVEQPDEVETWLLEAVRVDDSDVVVRIASFGSREEAESERDKAQDDLRDMTKAQFEEAYVTPSAPDGPDSL